MPSPSPKKSYQEQTLELIRSSNLAGLSAAVPGGMKVGLAHGMSPADMGGVDRRNPSTILVNPELANPAIGGGMKHTVPHEWEHVLQNNVDSKYQRDWLGQVMTEYTRIGGDIPKMAATLEKSATSTKLKSHLETLLGTPVADYIGGMKAGWANPREQFAELSSIEQGLKKDLTKDPVVRAEFFGNDQAMIDTYKAVTGYRTQRLDSKDLPPMTASASPAIPETSVLSKILDLVKGAIK